MSDPALPRGQAASPTHSTLLARIAARKYDVLVLLALAVLVFALRLPALFRSEINMDDSNFLTMGRELMRGATPYVDFWDHNPLGGVALFGLAGRLFGYSYVMLRWLTMAAVAAECFLLYLIAGRLGRASHLAGPSRIAGLVAAATYAVFSMNNLGLASDRIFYHAPLAALAIYLAVRQPVDERGIPLPLGWGKLLFIGLLVALSTQLKYLLPVEYAPVAAVVLLDTWGAHRRGEQTLGRASGRLLLAAALLAGPALALIALNAAYFGARDLLSQWAYANFTANSIYAATTPFSLAVVLKRFLAEISGNTLAWAGLLVAALYALTYRSWTAQEKRAYIIAGAWFIFPALAVIYARRMDGHHFLALLPSLSVLTGLVITSLLRRGEPQDAGGRPSGLRNGLLALLIVLAGLYPQAHAPVLKTMQLLRDGLTGRRTWPHDSNVDVGAWLDANVRPNDSLFLVDYNPVVYTMVDRPMPTPFPFPIFLIDGWYERIIGRSQVGVLDEIMARRPAWLVMQARPNREFTSQPVSERLQDYLAKDYTLVQTLPGIETYTEHPVDVEIYRANDYGGGSS